MDLHNLTGEQQILGMVMTDPDQLYRLDRLRSEHFGDVRHRHVYATIEKMVEQGKQPTLMLVTAELKQEDTLDQLGGIGWISNLVASCSISQFEMEGLADNIIQFHTKRRLKEFGAMIIDMIDDAQTAEQVLEYSQKRIVNISNDAVENKPISYRDCLTLALETALERDGSEELPGIASGFVDLDDLTNGFKPGDLVVLAGRPGMGKSAFAWDLGKKAAKAGIETALLSCEMTTEQWGKRGVASACGIPHQRIERGPLTAEEAQRVRDYLAENDLPFEVCTTAGYSITQIASLARKMKIQKGLRFLIVDYIQLLSSSRHFENRNLEVAEITRTLKQVALQLGIPILALSQLSREVEKRENKRPVLSDLRDSGSVEQDADIAIFLYRDEYYHPTTTTKRGEIEVIIGKNRSGSLGSVDLLFDLPTQRFSSKTAPPTLLAAPSKSRYSTSDVRF